MCRICGHAKCAVIFSHPDTPLFIGILGPGAPREIAHAIEMALSDPDYRARLTEVSRGVAAREHGGRVAQLLSDFDISQALVPKSFFAAMP